MSETKRDPDLGAYVRHQTDGGYMLVDQLLDLVRTEPGAAEAADRVLARAVALAALVRLAAGPPSVTEATIAAAARWAAGPKPP